MTSWLKCMLNKRLKKYQMLAMTPLNMYEFQAQSIKLDATMNLNTKYCSRHDFDLNHYPCLHIIALCRCQNILV